MYTTPFLCRCLTLLSVTKVYCPMRTNTRVKMFFIIMINARRLQPSGVVAVFPWAAAPVCGAELKSREVRVVITFYTVCVLCIPVATTTNRIRRTTQTEWRLLCEEVRCFSRIFIKYYTPACNSDACAFKSCNGKEIIRL